MLKLASIALLIFTLLMPSQLLEASEIASGDEEITLDDLLEEYDRIFKRNGVWYGIIEVTDISLSEWNCTMANGRCYQSRIMLNFSRELERLTSVTYDFTAKDSCRGVNLFGFCIGSWETGQSGTHTAFEKDRHGPFVQFILNSSEIQRAFGTSYDFQIITPMTYGPLESVEIIQFTFVLTDAEVESVLASIQEQYDAEVELILNTPGLTDAQRQQLLDQLNLEYATFTIDFQEELTSECVGDHCIAEDITPPGFMPSFNPWDTINRLLADYGQWFTQNLFASIIFIVLGGVFVKALATALVTKSFDAMGAIINTLLKGLASAAELFAKGLILIVSSTLTIFWAGIVGITSFVFRKG